MGRVKVDIKERATTYKAYGFYIKDKNILMCRQCNCQLDWKKKDNLTKHIQSIGHKKKASIPTTINTRQPTITKIIYEKQEEFTFTKKTVSMCLKANISLEKLKHPAVKEYFREYVQEYSNLPCAYQLKRTYVPLCGADIKHKYCSAKNPGLISLFKFN